MATIASALWPKCLFWRGWAGPKAVCWRAHAAAIKLCKLGSPAQALSRLVTSVQLRSKLSPAGSRGRCNWSLVSRGPCRGLCSEPSRCTVVQDRSRTGPSWLSGPRGRTFRKAAGSVCNITLETPDRVSPVQQSARGNAHPLLSDARWFWKCSGPKHPQVAGMVSSSRDVPATTFPTFPGQQL